MTQEKTAPIRSVSLENSRTVQAQRLSFLLEGQDTAGQVAVIEVLERKGFEPPAHVHRREDEIFAVLEGELRFQIGGETVRAKSGDVVFLPRNLPHAYRLESESARFLVTVAPAGFEGFLKGISQPAQDLDLPPAPAGAPDVPQWVALAQQYGLEFLPSGQ